MGHGSSTLEPCLAPRGAAPKHGWRPEEKREATWGDLAPYAYRWARPLGAGALLLKWFHLRFGDLILESRGHLFFSKSRNREEVKEGAGKGCWEEAPPRLRARSSWLSPRGGAAQVPCGSQVAERGGGLEGRES